MTYFSCGPNDASSRATISAFNDRPRGVSRRRSYKPPGNLTVLTTVTTDTTVTNATTGVNAPLEKRARTTVLNHSLFSCPSPRPHVLLCRVWLYSRVYRSASIVGVSPRACLSSSTVLKRAVVADCTPAKTSSLERLDLALPLAFGRSLRPFAAS